MSRPLTPYHLAMLERAVNYYGQSEDTRGRGVEVVGDKCGVSDTTIWRALRHKPVRKYRDIEAWIEGLRADFDWDIEQRAKAIQYAEGIVVATEGHVDFEYALAIVKNQLTL